MRSNAIMRIVVWSIVIVLLVGVLISVMLLREYRYRVADEVGLTMRTDTSESILCTGTVTGTAKVYSSPSTEADWPAVLKDGFPVEIQTLETINGQDWAFLASPEKGWVLMEHVELDVPTATAAAEVILPTEGILTFDPAQVREIEIEWVSGSIVIQPADVEKIQVSESDVSDAKYAMVWKQKGSKLSIEFCKENNIGFGFNFTGDLSKDLTILVPRDWDCDSLEIDAASASVEVRDLTIGEVDFDGASGECEFTNCTVEKFDLDTASGDVTFTGSLNTLECDAASANVYAVLENVPARIDMDTMSGDLEITMPENAGFTVKMDGMSTNFSSDYETSMKNGSYVCGDGSCRINVDGMSGDVRIHKGTAAPIPAETTVTEHQHTEECTTDPESCPDHAATAATEHHEESPAHQ